MRTLRCTAAALVIRALPDGEDTGHRIVHGQTVTAHGLSYDARWVYVVAPAGSGWSAIAHLEPVANAPDPAWPPVPHGLVEIREVFGDAATPRCSAGLAQLPAPLPLAWDRRTEVTSFRCHERMVGVFESAFREVYRRGLWSSLEEWGGCYNDRTARGLAKKSTHAWGIAVDVAVTRNQLGAKPTLDPRVVAIFEDHGFVWGGRWSRPDGMHFQLARAY